jgi:hypothetical protein
MNPLPPETDPMGNPIPDPGNVLRGLAINKFSDVPGIVPIEPSQQSMFGRGSYLVSALGDCSGCHSNLPPPVLFDRTKYLTGGRVFVTPPPLQPLLGTVRAASSNLEGSMHGFFNLPQVQFDTFLTLITQGIHAEDVTPDSGPPKRLAFPMPFDVFRNMELVDLQSIYVFLKSVGDNFGKPVLTDSTDGGPMLDKVIPDPALYCAPAGDAGPAVNCPSGMTCTSTTAPGECVAPCQTTADCATCQTCPMGGGTCAPLSGMALAGCLNGGY